MLTCTNVYKYSCNILHFPSCYFAFYLSPVVIGEQSHSNHIVWNDRLKRRHIPSFQWLLRFPCKRNNLIFHGVSTSVTYPHSSLQVFWRIADDFSHPLSLVVAYKSECYLKDTRHITFQSNFTLRRWNSSIFHGICIPPLTHRPPSHSPKWDLS